MQLMNSMAAAVNNVKEPVSWIPGDTVGFVKTAVLVHDLIRIDVSDFQRKPGDGG